MQLLLMSNVHLQYEGLDTFWTSPYCYQQLLSLRFSSVSPKIVIVNTQLILYLHTVKILKQKISQIICTIALKFKQCKLNLNASNKETLQCFGNKAASHDLKHPKEQITRMQLQKPFKILIYLPLLAYSSTSNEGNE